jgi:hypothetical protein
MVNFRRLVENDRALIDQWIENDPDHRAKGVTSALFFREFFSFAAEDEEGAVMFLALEARPPEMVVHIQFGSLPGTVNGVSERRTGKTFLEGFPTVKNQCKKCGAKAMIFETVNPKLAKFCARAWGFKPIAGTNDWRLSLEE